MNNDDRSAGRSTVYALIALMIVLFAALYICSPSVRGSDQYWYVGDLERVVEGDGTFKTNSVFPASMPDDATDLPRPWVQNKPVSYVVLMLTYLTQNGHVAWLIFNTICLFSAAVLTGRIVGMTRRKLLLFTAIFIFFPFNFYLATQALPEIFIMALIAAIHYLILMPPLNYKKILLLSLIAGILICHRPNYILLIAFIPLLFFFLYRRKSIVYSAIFIVAAMLVASCSVFFHGHLIEAPSIFETIAYNIQGKTNMGNFFPEPVEKALTFSDLLPILIEKFKGAIQLQFEIIGFSSVMFYVINIMLLSVVILLFQRKLKGPVNIVCLMFIAIHFATIILFYNQYRYAAAIMPSLFILIYQIYQNARWNIVKDHRLKVAFLAGCIFVSAAIGYQVRKQAVVDQVIIAEFRKLNTSQDFNSIMCVYDPAFSLVAGYALSPKLIYYFPGKMSAPEWIAAAKKMSTRSGIINPKSTLYKQLKPQITKEAEIEGLPLVYFEIGVSQ